MVSGVDEKFPSGRVRLECHCFWCVGGDREGLGACVLVLALGDTVCVYSGCYLGVYGMLMVCLVLCGEFYVFLWFLALVRVRIVPYLRRYMIYCMVPGPRYFGGPICTL